MPQCVIHSKHGYGWNRTLFDGLAGTETWCGLGVLAHNAVKISRLIEAKNQPGVSTEKPTPARARGRPPDPTNDAPAPDPISPM